MAGVLGACEALLRAQKFWRSKMFGSVAQGHCRRAMAALGRPRKALKLHRIALAQAEQVQGR